MHLLHKFSNFRTSSRGDKPYIITSVSFHKKLGLRSALKKTCYKLFLFRKSTDFKCKVFLKHALFIHDQIIYF